MAEFWISRKVLVTGASGFIGLHLFDVLKKRKAVVATTELDEYAPHADWTFHCNLTDYDDVNRVISRFQPEIVFHLAAQPIVDIAFHAPFDTFETNVRGTYNLLEACSRIGCVKSFVHFSTDKVYGETVDEGGSTERSRLDGVAHPYNASKLCGDIIAQSYASFSLVPTSIIRSGNIYGEGDTHWDRLIPYVCKMLVTGQPIELRSDGFMFRDYLYVSDVIDALLMVAKQDRGNSIYNLGSTETYTVKEIVQKIREISGIDDKSVPTYKANTKMELKYQHMDYSKIKNELGWEPKVGIDEGLTKTFKWYADMFSNWYEDIKHD